MKIVCRNGFAAVGSLQWVACNAMANSLAALRSHNSHLVESLSAADIVLLIEDHDADGDQHHDEDQCEDDQEEEFQIAHWFRRVLHVLSVRLGVQGARHQMLSTFGRLARYVDLVGAHADQVVVVAQVTGGRREADVVVRRQDDAGRCEALAKLVGALDVRAHGQRVVGVGDRDRGVMVHAAQLRLTTGQLVNDRKTISGGVLRRVPGDSLRLLEDSS